MQMLLLHNIRSAHNVGAIFRTADAAGIDKIFLSGYTPRPIDRFGRVQKEIAKTALGAEKQIPWEYTTTYASAIKAAHKIGATVVGVEQDDRSISYKKYRAKKSTLFIVGSEVEGMSQPLRKACDVILEIPMRGTKESLNVSVATGIILFACL